MECHGGGKHLLYDFFNFEPDFIHKYVLDWFKIIKINMIFKI